MPMNDIIMVKGNTKRVFYLWEDGSATESASKRIIHNDFNSLYKQLRADGYIEIAESMRIK